MNNNKLRYVLLIVGDSELANGLIDQFQKLQPRGTQSGATDKFLAVICRFADGHQNRRGLKGKAVPGETEVILIPKTEGQAARLLVLIEDLLKSRGDVDFAATEIWLGVDSLTVGLYEEIQSCFDRDAARRILDENLAMFRVMRLKLYRPTSQVGDEPPLHVRPDQPLKWQDLEFSQTLLDEDELEQLRRCQLSRRSVLITGDRGTGKTLVARFLHYHCRDSATGSFVEVNLPAIAESLFEAEMFGIAQGTATDVRARTGLLEAADRGSLFLDEIAEAPEAIKVKLLRIISEGTAPTVFRRVGDTQERVTTVRHIAATNVKAEELSRRLRSDLLARFPMRIHLKPISQKKGDSFRYLMLAIEHFTRIELAYNPSLIPTWDQIALKDAFERRQVPDNFRDLHAFVDSVLDRRRIYSNTAWKPDVSRSEIRFAIEEFAGKSSFFALPGKEASTISMIRELAQGASVNFGDRIQYSQGDVSEIVFLLRKLSLDIALWFGDGNEALARRIYGMPNPSSFKNLCQNPARLHPASPKRRM
jgi:MoxR-like ATPase